jgi:beta-lactamase class A
MMGSRRLLTGLTSLAVIGSVTMGTTGSAAAPRSVPPRSWPTAAPDEPSPARIAADDQTAQHQIMSEQSAEQAAEVAAASADAERRRRDEAALTAVLAQYDRTASVDLSVAVIDRRSGRTFSYGGRRLFETASVVKVDILATLLLQAQRAHRTLSAPERSLATAMIEDSDNAAASELWSRIGGIAGSTRVFGLSATKGGTGGDWGLTTTTAEDQARLVAALADPDGPLANADYLLDLMSDVEDDQDWGVSAAARSGETVALKNGWLARTNQQNRWIVNSLGRISDADTDVSIVVLSRGQASYGAGIDMVEDIARATRQYLKW